MQLVLAAVPGVLAVLWLLITVLLQQQVEMMAQVSAAVRGMDIPTPAINWTAEL